jgi:flagellar protein FlaG
MNINSLGTPLTARLDERSVPAPDAQSGRAPAPGAAAAGAAPSREQVTEAVRKINEGMAVAPQSLEFTIDDESDEIIVKIVDRGTREVVRQIPSVEALEIAKSIDKMRGLLISQTA